MRTTTQNWQHICKINPQYHSKGVQRTQQQDDFPRGGRAIGPTDKLLCRAEHLDLLWRGRG